MKKYGIFSFLILTSLATRAMYQQNRGANTYPPYRQNVPDNQAHRPIDLGYLTIDPSSAQITPVQRQTPPQRPANINEAARGFFDFMRAQLEAMIQEPKLSNDNKGLARRIIEILPEASQGSRSDSYAPESPTTSRR